jgi:hypothetical protein
MECLRIKVNINKIHINTPKNKNKSIKLYILSMIIKKKKSTKLASAMEKEFN